MIWKEFKKQVEEAGISDDTEIQYIDVTIYRDDNKIKVVKRDRPNTVYIECWD